MIEIAVAVGDQVEEGDTLLTLESDKAAMEIPSSHSGKILEILVSEGDKLGTGDKVAVIEAAAEVAEAPEQAPAAPAAAETQKTTQAEAKKPAQESSQPALQTIECISSNPSKFLRYYLCRPSGSPFGQRAGC